MTSSSITKVPALGQAWSGDWQARLFERLRVRGLESVTALSEKCPTASTIEMADELSTDHEVAIDRADVAAEQLVQIWREEATRGGSQAIERFARRLLVGELHQGIPGGWRSDWRSEEASPAMSRLAAATSAWTCNLSKEHRAAARRVFAALIEEGREGRIPPGWLPVNADDPLLTDVFRRHWADPSSSSAV